MGWKMTVLPSIQAFLIVSAFRLGCVLVGFGGLYLGYRLFRLGVYEKAGELRVQFHGAALVLRQVGPGVFFAIFGVGIAGIGFSRQFDASFTYAPPLNRPGVTQVADAGQRSEPTLAPERSKASAKETMPKIKKVSLQNPPADSNLSVPNGNTSQAPGGPVAASNPSGLSGLMSEHIIQSGPGGGPCRNGNDATRITKHYPNSKSYVAAVDAPSHDAWDPFPQERTSSIGCDRTGLSTIHHFGSSGWTH
jgi:hypothetical protein